MRKHRRDHSRGNAQVTVERQDVTDVDYDTTQTNVTADPLVLPAYRYGGCIAYRAPYH